MMQLTPYVLPPLRPEVTRDHLGRYKVPDPAGSGKTVVKTRCTTFAQKISDSASLSTWQKQQVALGLAMAPQLLGSIDLAKFDINADELPRELKAELNVAAEAAMDSSGANVKRERGTQLHYFTEALDVGYCTIDGIPLEYREECAAYLRLKDEAGLITPPEGVERILNVPEIGIVGTADRFPMYLPGDVAVVGDVKTGLRMKWLEWAMQLAMLSRADKMLEWNGPSEPYWVDAPKVNQQVGVVIYAPLDQAKAEIYLVDLDEGWRYVQLAQEVNAARNAGKGKGLYMPFDAAAWKAEAASIEFGDFKRTDDGLVEDVSAFAIAAPVDPAAPAAIEAPPFAVNSDTVAELDAELTTILEARDAAFEAYKAAGHKRRKKAMIQADELANVARDGELVASVLQTAIDAVVKAYGLEGNTDAPAASDPAPANDPEPEAAKSNQQMCVPCGGWFDADQFETDHGNVLHSVPGSGTAHATVKAATANGYTPDNYAITAVEGTIGEDLPTGTPVSVADDNPFADFVIEPPAAIDPATEAAITAIDASSPVLEVLQAVAVAHAAVWTPELQQRGLDRVEQYAATVHDALDQAATPADLVAVWNQFGPTGWSDSFTQYGKAVLVSKNTNQTGL